MTNKKYTIKGGLYLVINPSMDIDILLNKTEAALKGGIDILQIWNHWKEDADKLKIVHAISALAHSYNVPVIINDNVELLMNTELDGIHFDSIPDDFSEIKSRFTSNTIIGITCGNDISKIKLAMNHQLSYISFCSIFPSSSVSTCDLVDKEVISQARALTNMPIFLSGGIDLNNIDQLKETQMDGVALVSGIMSAENVKEKVMQYQQKLKKNKK